MKGWERALMAYAPSGLRARLFDRQQAFFDDPQRQKALLCGRRGGKTETIAPWLLDGAQRFPGTRQVYVARSQKSARRIIWPSLETIARACGVKGQPHEQSLEYRLSNGSVVWVAGCDDKAQCEDFRGPKYKRVAIDEAGSFPTWLEYLVEDVFRPALMDLRGEITMSGSPGLIPLGYFFDRTDGDRPWSTHRWCCLDNPHVPGREEIDRLKSENRWDDDHPTLVREWYGKWVRDDTAIVYPFDPARNIGAMPETDGKVRRVLSVDLGFEPDACGFVVGASVVGFPDWYCEKAWRKHRLTVAKIAGEIEQAQHNARLEGKPIDNIVIDCGALGKTISADLIDTYGIFHEPAEKRDKLAAIHGFRGALLAGTAKIAPLACQQLREEWSTLAWNDTRTDHSPLCVDDLADPVLYNFRAHGLFYKRELEPPPAGSVEARAAYKAQRVREFERQRGRRRRTA